MFDSFYRHYFVGCINRIDNPIISDSKSVQFFFLCKFLTSCWKRILSESIDANCNSISEAFRNLPKVFFN